MGRSVEEVSAREGVREEVGVVVGWMSKTWISSRMRTRRVRARAICVCVNEAKRRVGEVEVEFELGSEEGRVEVDAVDAGCRNTAKFRFRSSSDSRTDAIRSFTINKTICQKRPTDKAENAHQPETQVVSVQLAPW